MKRNSLRLRRSDIARNIGIPISKLKFYTQEGLLKIADTTEGGMTLYDLHEVKKSFSKIERFKKEGKSLAQIRALIS